MNPDADKPTAPPSPGSAGPAPSKRSLAGLDSVNLLMADVRDGVGPYLAVYLQGTMHWSAGSVGLAMAASNVGAAIAQIPAGLWVDATPRKRTLVGVSGLAVGAACLAMILHTTPAVVVTAQALTGAASAVIAPALAALTLGLVGRRRMPGRVSRNESFNHTGNFLAAGLAGVLGQSLGYGWIFGLVAAFAILSAGAVCLIRPEEIDHAVARGADADGEKAAGKSGDQVKPASAVLKCRPFLVFLGAVMLFHFGNAAMLPMAGQVLAKAHPESAALAMSACIIAAQAVMIGIAWAVGRAMHAGWGRKAIFLAAFAVLPVRGVLYTLTSSPFGVVGIQLLDGVAAGIFGVISVVIAADLMRGTGRFNLAQGLVALATGAGAGLSNVVAGWVSGRWGFNAGFLTLAVAAAVAFGYFLLLMPETQDGNAPASTAPEPAPAAA